MEQCTFTSLLHKSWLTPGIAHALVSPLLMATNSSIGFPSRSILAPPASLFHLVQCVSHWENVAETSINRMTDSSSNYLVTTGSAAWLGPHRPSRPLPTIPVRPMGFLTYTIISEIFYTEACTWRCAANEQMADSCFGLISTMYAYYSHVHMVSQKWPCMAILNVSW